VFLSERYRTLAPLLRVYYTGRLTSTISPTVKQYCKYVLDHVLYRVYTFGSYHRFDNKGHLALATPADLQAKIVVTTSSSARTISMAKIPRGHFTHIFIDEAAQVYDSVAIIITRL